MKPVADYFGVPVEAFYEEALAEKILADIASGAFVVKGNRRGPVWMHQPRGSEPASPPTASGAPTLAQALETTLNALAASPHRSELKSLLVLLVDTDAPAYRQRLAELLAPGEPIKQTEISLRNQARIQNAA